MIMIGMPSYDGKMEWQTVSSIIGLGHLCAKANIGYAVDVIPGDAFVGHARNILAHRFLKGGFRDLLFVDADIAFDPMDAAKLCKAEPEIVCGLYRIKKDRLVYPARYFDPVQTHPSDSNLIRMMWGPAGFMRIRASVFEKMQAAWPDEYYIDATSEEKIYDYFPAGRHGNNFSSEDVAFCDKARTLGIDIWAMQGIELKHTGAKTFESKWEMITQTIEEST